MKRLENENSPAFPINEEETDRIDDGIGIYTGLTKREYIATQAMVGILSADAQIPRQNAVTSAVMRADALLKELEKE